MGVDMKTRDLIFNSYEALSATNPELDGNGPNFDLLVDLGEWMDNGDNKEITLHQTEVGYELRAATIATVVEVTKLMAQLQTAVYPQTFGLKDELEDVLEAWNRFQIAWYR